MKTAIILKRNMVDIAWATSSSSAFITGAVAAMADPPHMDVPTPISVVVFPNNYYIKDMVNKIGIFKRQIYMNKNSN